MALRDQSTDLKITRQMVYTKNIGTWLLQGLTDKFLKTGSNKYINQFVLANRN